MLSRSNIKWISLCVQKMKGLLFRCIKSFKPALLFMIERLWWLQTANCVTILKDWLPSFLSTISLFHVQSISYIDTNIKKDILETYNSSYFLVKMLYSKHILQFISFIYQIYIHGYRLLYFLKWLGIHHLNFKALNRDSWRRFWLVLAVSFTLLQRCWQTEREVIGKRDDFREVSTRHQIILLWKHN